jgi:hypothetical protein
VLDPFDAPAAAKNALVESENGMAEEATRMPVPHRSKAFKSFAVAKNWVQNTRCPRSAHTSARHAVESVNSSWPGVADVRT